MTYMHRQELSVLIEGLKELGFRKRAGLNFTIPLEDGYDGCVSVGAATEGHRKDCATLHPLVSVRVAAVMDMVFDITQRDPHPYNPSTITVPLYTLVEGDRSWWEIVPSSAETGEELTDLVAAVEKFGLPWMRRHTSMEAVKQQVINHPHVLSSAREILPVIERLQGHENRAQELVDQYQAEFGNTGTLYAGRVSHFTQRFRATRPT